MTAMKIVKFETIFWRSFTILSNYVRFCSTTLESVTLLESVPLRWKRSNYGKIWPTTLEYVPLRSNLSHYLWICLTSFKSVHYIGISPMTLESVQLSWNASHYVGRRPTALEIWGSRPNNNFSTYRTAIAKLYRGQKNVFLPTVHHQCMVSLFLGNKV